MMNLLNSLVFFATISSMIVLYFILGHKRSDIEFHNGKAYLSEEKRELTVLQPISAENYLNGDWAKTFDSFVNDNFPFRESLMDWSVELRKLRGIKVENQEKIIYLKPRNENQPKFDDQGNPIEYLDEYDESYSNGLLILNGRVYPRSGGSTKMAANFARMVSEYAAQLEGEVRVLTAVPPLSSAFIPAEDYRHYNGQNMRTLEAIRNNLTNGVIFCDVFTELNNHAGEQLYFGTDHHWKPLGAYYAYVAFCKGAGFTPVPLEQMEKRTKTNFLGTMYQMTQDPSVKEHPDEMDYYIPKIQTNAVRYGKFGFQGSSAKVFEHGCSGGITYSTFLGGDRPLMKITTNVKNGRKAVVIKNSMGNAFSVYLISHYEELWIVDFRYSKHNLLEIIRTNSINDLIFAPGMNHVMNPNTVNMMRRLGTQSGIYIPPKQNPAIDSTIVIPDTIP
ncbi:MAG: hypothetical protein FJX80_10530 [Bacteroidetes bacterium]|nr:hypothetical protein [Bacteroidota bacterium]